MGSALVINQLKATLWNLTYTQWRTEVLFSFRWWILAACIIIAYAIWWKLADKSRLSQLLLFGSFIAVGRIVMDIIGTNMVLWSYDIRELPFSPSPFLHDFTITPLAFMLVYQFCPTWNKFLVWLSIVSGIITFIFFPVLIAFNILKYYNWNHVYSFILIILIGCLARLVLLAILQLEQNYQRGIESSKSLIYQSAIKPDLNIRCFTESSKSTEDLIEQNSKLIEQNNKLLSQIMHARHITKRSLFSRLKFW